jgi:gamma-glutamylcysteine synthetase
MPLKIGLFQRKFSHRDAFILDEFTMETLMAARNWKRTGWTLLYLLRSDPQLNSKGAAWKKLITTYSKNIY